MKVTRRADHTLRLFLKRTVSAQIHLFTCLMAIVGLAVLLPYAERQGFWQFCAALAFGLTAILVFAVSATYHFLSDGYSISPEVEAWMEKLDQWAIYLFIAGTYTPLLLNAISAPWRLPLICAIWSMALLGILYTALRHHLPRWAQSRATYTFLFILMGWTLIIRIQEAWTHMSFASHVGLVGGAIAYSVGAVVYATKRPKLFEGVFGFHELWHVLVSTGFLFHYIMIGSIYFAATTVASTR